MEVPSSVIITVITVLAGAIATMGRVIWSSMQRRERELGERIDEQGGIIHTLQKDIKHLSGGCGLESCHWKFRRRD
jgi:hypothetical protein